MSLAEVHPYAPSNDAVSPLTNIEAEQALLGAVLYDNAAFERIEDLAPEHFYEPIHGKAFELISTTIQGGGVADPVLVDDRLKQFGAYDELGGIRYLADLVDRAPPSSATRDYARLIVDLAVRRQVVTIAGDAVAAVTKDHEAGAREHIEELEQALFALAETKQQRGFQSFATVLGEALESAAQAYGRDGSLSGLSTGLIDLDRKLGGLHKSDLIIIAARPSMGKTALATNIAFDVAKTYAYETTPEGQRKTTRGGVVGFFSLEMSGEQLAARILAEVSGVPSDRLRRGDVQAHEFARVRDAALMIQNAPLHIDDTGGISIAKLAARARRLKRTTGLDLIVVDYLQLVTTAHRRGDGRVQEVSEITQGLKALAKELNVPVIALSQLSRQVENREDKRPQLSDLRESGSIEQDADVVAFVYRESYYLSRSEPKPGTDEHFKWQERMDACAGQADLIIGKQRHGPIGTVRLSFSEATTKFGNLAREGRYDPASVRLPYGDD